jgi:drug/metabolite transporter (DMT)-like permease
MPILAIALLFVAACLHALWNLLLKRSGEKYITSWWATIIGGLIFAPVLAFTGLPPREVWPLLAASLVLEALYFILLSYAYADNDFSLIYPMARGTAPAFLAIWSVIFLHEKPTVGGSIGLGMIVLGLIVVGSSALRLGGGSRPHLRGIISALAVALIISAYTAVDGTAVKLTPALGYATSIFVLLPLLTTPLSIARYGWPRLREEWHADRLTLVIVGVLGVLAYLFALLAYKMAPIGYAGAIREMSVVIGAFAGWHFLGEKMGRQRVIGAAIIFGGILIIALFG